MKKDIINWKVVTPIIADILVSPWNLLIGAVLVSRLNLISSAICIVIGYIILTLIFYTYGGLGYKLKLKTSELLEPVFGMFGTKVFLSGILAFGQIGWFAIITQIAGESVALLLNLPVAIGIIIYAVLIFLMTITKIQTFSFMKWVIGISSFGLILLLLQSVVSSNSFVESGMSLNNISDLIWGIAVVVSSLISFSTVTPDFVYNLESKRDLKLVSIFGMLVPGILTLFIGCLIFFKRDTVSMASIIALTFIPVMSHIFNIVTNTDAAQAIITPANRLSYIFKISFNKALIIGIILGTFLSLLNITSQLEGWLIILGGLYPSIIGITLAYYYLAKDKELSRFALAILVLLFIISLIFRNPVMTLVGMIVSFLLILIVTRFNKKSRY